MTPSPAAYPWYSVVSGDEIHQGDILESCRVYSPPPEISSDPFSPPVFKWNERDVIVMSQSCDLVKGREKVEEVLVCTLWRRSEIKDGHLSTLKGLEDLRRGNLPPFHLIVDCSLPDFQRESRIVEFRRVYSLPIAYVRKYLGATAHLRLLPPYREHLSQAFARFFMRVGLPMDIPPFR